MVSLSLYGKMERLVYCINDTVYQPAKRGCCTTFFLKRQPPVFYPIFSSGSFILGNLMPNISANAFKAPSSVFPFSASRFKNLCISSFVMITAPSHKKSHLKIPQCCYWQIYCSFIYLEYTIKQLHFQVPFLSPHNQKKVMKSTKK